MRLLAIYSGNFMLDMLETREAQTLIGQRTQLAIDIWGPGT